jgi:hypothetical protein
MAPICLTYGWVAFTQGQKMDAIYLWALCALLVIMCLLMIRHARRVLERTPFSASTVEAADRENIAFLLFYLLPLFTSQFVSLNVQVLGPIVVIFAVITATGYNYHFNPLLGLFKWHFYKVQSKEGVTYVLITKKQIRAAASVAEVGQLTEYILLDLSRG